MFYNELVNAKFMPEGTIVITSLDYFTLQMRMLRPRVQLQN